MRWAGHAARIGERRNAYRILVLKPEGKRLLGPILLVQWTLPVGLNLSVIENNSYTFSR
jgi:hypothetical protein